MRMLSKWTVLGTTGTLALAAGAHYAFIVAYPHAIIAGLQRRLINNDYPVNSLRHGNRPTAKDRLVVGPSPDIIYSIGVYDVSKAPLRITGPLTDSYASLSLYAHNSDNFFVQNDQQVEGGHFDLVLIGPNATDPHVNGVPTVRAPTNTGIILFRFFAGEGSQFEKIDNRRREITCTPLR